MNICELYILRHGETNFNIEERVQGQINKESYLTKKGIIQAENRGKKFKSEGINFDKIYSSDLRRAKETTKILLPYVTKQNTTIEYYSDLRERGFGSLEGKTIQELNIKEHEIPGLFSIDQKGLLEDSESLSSIKKRNRRIYMKTIGAETAADSSKKILLVSHEWIISYFVNQILNEDYRLHEMKNLGFHYFLFNKNQMIKHKLNQE